MATTAGYAHIEFKPDGWPMIAGTRISVARVALDYTVHHLSVEEIPRLYGGLSLAQVLAALAYYFDHKDDVDRRIEARHREAVAGRQLWSDSQEQLRSRVGGDDLTP